jgi:hypothetical protein
MKRPDRRSGRLRWRGLVGYQATTGRAATEQPAVRSRRPKYRDAGLEGLRYWAADT